MLDGYTYYGGCQPNFVATSTWVVCGGQWDGVEATTPNDGGAPPTNRLNGSATVNGTTVTIQGTFCVPGNPPVPSLDMRGYTATPGHLTFIYAVTNGMAVSTFTKQ